MSEGKTFIIRVNYGGLGDHLFYSHLPRIAKQYGGYDKVLISELSDYRDLEYRKLIWQMNPFVDGFTDENAPYPEFERISEGMNILDKVMLERALDDGQRFHEPEIYYQPKLNPDLANAKIFDPNYVSKVGDISENRLLNLLNIMLRYSERFQLQPWEKYYGVQPDIPMLVPKDVYEYADIIASCQSFFCLASGGATLAAALGKSATVFSGKGMNPMFKHSQLHHYVEV